MPRFIISGFGTFGGVAANPTESLVRWLSQKCVKADGEITAQPSDRVSPMQPSSSASTSYPDTPDEASCDNRCGRLLLPGCEFCSALAPHQLLLTAEDPQENPQDGQGEQPRTASDSSLHQVCVDCCSVLRVAAGAVDSWLPAIMDHCCKQVPHDQSLMFLHFGVYRSGDCFRLETQAVNEATFR